MYIVITSQSKWGHHPVDYATFCLLKRLKTWYHEALRRRAEWERWTNKAPQNRIIWQYLGQARVNKGPKPEPNWTHKDVAILSKLVKVKILQVFDVARHGKPAEEVKPLALPDTEILKLIKEIENTAN